MGLRWVGAFPLGVGLALALGPFATLHPSTLPQSIPQLPGLPGGSVVAFGVALILLGLGIFFGRLYFFLMLAAVAAGLGIFALHLVGVG